MKSIFRFLGVAFVACSLLVACGDDEKTDPENGGGTNVDGTTYYTITVSANPAEAGTVTGGGKYEKGKTAILEASPKADYVFVNWEDGSTANPRNITVTSDMECVANFAEQTGVNVTFGDNTWAAGTTNASYYAASNAILIAAAQTNSTSYPQINMQLFWESTPTTGTLTGTSSVSTSNGVAFDGSSLWYYETEDDFITINYQDGSSVNAGDWWDKSLTVNVTALDLTSMTVSLVANATMGKVMDVLDGGTRENATERTFSCKVLGQQLTAAKGFFKANKGVAKFSAR